MKTTKREKIYNLLSKAQSLVVGTDLENAYFDFCQYHMHGINEELSFNDLMDIEKSAKTIIKIAKLQKDIISILY